MSYDDSIEFDGKLTAFVAAIIVAVLFVIYLFAAFTTTPRDKVALAYGGGPFGAKYLKTIQPGSGYTHYGFFSNTYKYPVTQRSYIISKNKDEGDRGRADFVASATADNQQVEWESATYFKLNLSKIRQFHEQIGLKYHAYGEKGWDKMLDETVRQQIENSLNSVTRNFTVAQVYSDRQAVAQIQNEVGTNLKERVNAVFGDDYFCGPSYTVAKSGDCPDLKFVIKHVSIPDSVKTAYEAVAAAKVQVETKRQEVAQNRLVAQSIRELQSALNGPQGYNYVLLQAIKDGRINFWVLRDGQAVTLPADVASKVGK